MDKIIFETQYIDKIFKIIPNKNSISFFSLTDHEKNIEGVVIKINKKLYLNFFDMNKECLIQKNEFNQHEQNYIFIEKIEYLPHYLSFDEPSSMVNYLEKNHFVKNSIKSKELNLLVYQSFLEKNHIEVNN